MISVEAVYALCIGALVAGGVYLLLRARTFPIILGLGLLSYAVNLYLVGMGRLVVGRPAFSEQGIPDPVDPIPQALVLTAIVIGFAMTAFSITLAMKSYELFGNDHIDGRVDP